MKKKNHAILLSTTIIFLVLVTIHKNMSRGGNFPYTDYLELYTATALLGIWWIYEIFVIVLKGEKSCKEN